MAHSKRRISVPMSEETIKSLTRLSEATGGSIGGSAGQFLEQLNPQFNALAEAIELATTDPVRSAEILQKTLLEGQLLAVEQQLDMLGKND